LTKILSRPEVTYNILPKRNETLSQEVVQQVEIAVKYAGYIDRQELEVQKFKKLEDKSIPNTFDFSTVPSLRLEARQKFTKIRPATIGQAARISGVSPADISILMVWLKRSANANRQNDSVKETETCDSELEE
jgi:tRNA uridine 5-carboxymethylaminomethyl modification enzyme